MQINPPSGVHATARTYSRLGMLLLALVFLWPTVGRAATARRMPLDAVMLMDDSGSMRKTDPLKLRFSALSLFIRLLSDDDAVGILRFDGEASTLAALHPLGDDAHRPRLDDLLARFSTHGAYTNIYAGLKLALEEMQQRGREVPEKAVILISDGLMDVNPAAGASNEESLRTLRDTLLPAYREAHVKIVTLALSPAADRALLEEIAATTQGHFFYAPQAQALSQAVYSIFDRLKQPEMIPVIGQRLAIDPSVKEATFFVITDGAQADVTLVRPDGAKIDKKRREAAVKWYVGKDYVLVTIQEPLAGEWRVEMAQPRPIRVAVITDLQLEVELDRPSYVAEQPVQISARLVAEGTASSGALPLEELLFIAEVTPPGASAGRRLSLIPQGATTVGDTSPASAASVLGQWRTTRYMPPSESGEYRGRVIAQAPTFSREKSFAFHILPLTKTPPPEDRPSLMIPHSLPNSSTAASGEALPPEQALAEDDKASWAPWTKALRRWAIGHSLLLAFGSAALVGLRLKTGAWWKLP